MDGWTDEWTYGRKISPFYRTLSPIGAAALPATMKTKDKVEQGKGTADHLMPLGYLFYLMVVVVVGRLGPCCYCKPYCGQKSFKLKS